MFKLFGKKKKEETVPEANPEKKDVDKAKEPDADAQAKAGQAELLKHALEEFKANKDSHELLLQILAMIRKGTFEVPMTVTLSEEDQKAFMNVKPGDTVTTKGKMRLKPDFLKDAEGNLFFPVFTSRNETEEAYRNHFSWMTFSGQQAVEAARSNPDLSGLIINGFTQAFVLGRKMLDLLASGTMEHTLEKGTVVTLTMVDHSQKALRKEITGYLKKNTAVKKAFLAVLSKDGKKESYVCIIENPLPEKRFKLLVNTLNELVQKTEPDLPVDYAPYPALKKQLLACGIQPFYVRDGYPHKTCQVPLEDSKTFFISAFSDDEGWECEYSFDFEYADDFHYTITGDEARRLVKKLQAELKTEETRLPVLVHDYLGETLKSPGKIDSALRSMFWEMDVEFTSIHF